jgi:CBS domain-containing protein
MMEYHDRAQDIEDELQHVRGALLDDTIATLGPAEPICLPPMATVEDAIARMLERRQACVLIVDADGRLTGILTERDVLMRVAGAGRDPRRTALRDVMTPKPVALAARDRVAYAVHCMHVAGFRTVPLVDTEQRPIGIVNVSDVIHWLAQLFPEAILNLPPGDTLKRPHEMDAG